MTSDADDDDRPQHEGELGQVSPMRVARSVKLLAAHRRREAVLSEST